MQRSNCSSTHLEGKNHGNRTVEIDLAKNVFAVHGVDASGKAVLIRPSVKRAALPELVANLPPCLIGMEACSGAHHWMREFAKFGHTARLMAPKFVTPYRLSGKKGKNDAADAQAICEAVSRPNMRFVPVKTLDQQGQLLIHRARQGFVEHRTATLNRTRAVSPAVEHPESSLAKQSVFLTPIFQSWCSHFSAYPPVGATTINPSK